MNVNTLLAALGERGVSPEDPALIQRAYDFASRAHAGEKRKSGEPYIMHPLAVAQNLAEMRLDTPTIAAGLLHDVCEDTPITAKELRKEFGDEIAFLVEGATKLGRVKYRGQERSAESLRKMFLAIAEDIRIVLIKLADRLHNIQTLQYVATEKQRRIALETLEIYAPIAHRLGIGELKGQLEDLAFPWAYPDEHHWLMEHLQEPFAVRQEFIERFKPIAAETLKRAGIRKIDIHARAKHHYSLWQKLKKYELDISKVFDLMALRVIVPTVEDCYNALGAIHTAWKPVPGLVKDYIALPKPNSYRSLHTTVFGPEKQIVEFQIRTPEMHEEAEGGIAAHWAYSERKQSDAYRRREAIAAPRRELAWIQQLREWQKEFANPKEFLEALKIDFFKNRIFALTPKGDVIDLPEGATPVDFAYSVHTDIGNTAAGARVNGKMVSLDYRLKNGEVVEILMQKSKKPNPGWLRFAKSVAVRRKISSALRKADSFARLRLSTPRE